MCLLILRGGTRVEGTDRTSSTCDSVFWCIPFHKRRPIPTDYCAVIPGSPWLDCMLRLLREEEEEEEDVEVEEEEEP